jgi:Leucine-rich repeat (LRR) protein
MIIITCILIIFLAIVIGFGIWFLNSDNETEADLQWKRKTINDCINQTSQNYDEIRELVCDPGSDVALLGHDYDLLSKLTNLETITIVGISDASDAQNLCIRSNPYGGARFKIDDIDLLGTEGSFKNLKSLELYDVQIETLPDLSELTELKSLSISGADFTKLDDESVNWENIVSLNINSTNIHSIDKEIINKLYNLKALDVSYCNITDISFVLNLPKLEEFSYLGHDTHGIDLKCLNEHPNYDEAWMKD